MSSSSVMASTIGSLFPDAPAGVVAPESARALFRVRMRRWRENHRVWLYIWVFAVVIGPLVALTFSSPIAAAVALGVMLAIAGILMAVQWSRAAGEFWVAYAQARGLQIDDGTPWLSCNVPLLSLGDEREFDRVLTGRVGDASAAIGQYTYTDVTYSTDSDGHRTRQEEDHHFTVVAFRLPDQVASRFRGVYCRNNTLGFGGLQDKLSHDRGIKLESNDFHKRYDLRVVDEQDDIALYELFSPTFIEQLTLEYHALWEQVGSDLLVYWDDHRTSSAELDDLCAAAWRVYRRYCEEYQ